MADELPPAPGSAFAPPPPAPPPSRWASDGGLSGLGLIMQLVGGLMTAFVASYGFFMVIMLGMGGGRRGAGSALLWLFLILAGSLARSVAHKKAGDRLVQDGPGTPTMALNRYLMFAAVHTGGIGVIMLANDTPGSLVLGVVLVLAAWPLILLLLARPRLAEFGDAVPPGADRGFEGASILLLIFGAMGLSIGAIMLLGWLEWPGEVKTQLMGVGMLAAYVLLVIRSSLHLRAGIRGVSATHMNQTADAVAKYAQFAVVTSVVVGAVFFLGIVASMPEGAPGAAMMMMMLMAVMITWLLLVWPLAVRRFFSDRQFATFMETQGPTRQLSPDRGLPALGWLLLAFGGYALAMGLAGLLLGDLADERALRRMSRGGNPLGQMLGMMGGAGDKSPWYGISVAALQVWAGVELVRMTPRYKLAGLVFGGVASAVALYIYMPMLSDLMRGGLGMLQNPLASMTFVSVAMALAIPVATLFLVQRKIHDPRQVGQTFE